VHDQDFLGLDLEEARQRATDLPDRFMKVCGSSSQTLWPWTLARAIRPQ
jgi:hypothetical protein